jgi:hypothetical protein|nr:hypothetical protein Q903MT_gene1662 [Picea sitchensis]
MQSASYPAPPSPDVWFDRMINGEVIVGLRLEGTNMVGINLDRES